MKLSEKNIFLQKYGNWTVVTGASSGIGRALAIELAKIGFDLILVGRNQPSLAELGQKIENQYFSQTKIIVADLSNTGGNQQVLDKTRDLPVGLLVLSAGFGTSGLFLQGDMLEESEMIDVNILSPLILSQAFALRFSERGKGGIIFLSSIVAFQGVPFAANYAATKAYIQTLAEGLQQELGQNRIDVLAACPGPVGSGFATRAKMVMGKTLTPEEIALPILSALGKKGTVFPGTLTKILKGALWFLPRWGKVKVMGMVMGGFTKHRR